MYMKDGLHLSGKGAAVFADKLSAAVDSDMGTYIPDTYIHILFGLQAKSAYVPLLVSLSVAL